VILSAASLAAAHGQGWRQVGELLLAFGLGSLVGLERQLRGKPAGLRTQALVGTSAALFMLVSKYGFGDVIANGQVTLDPSRVAAQVVSGIGFLGAGLILTRRGTVQGLTTAASVWETSAIGMACAGGLPLLAAVVTALRYVTVFAFTPLSRRLPGSVPFSASLRVEYGDGRGALREILRSVTSGGWTVSGLRQDGGGVDEGGAPTVIVVLDLAGARDAARLLPTLAELPAVSDVQLLDEEDED
jgi:putative Mg2+ transporter-C (MgtC) family protein